MKFVGFFYETTFRLGGFSKLDFMAEHFDAASEGLGGSILFGAGEIDRSQVAIELVIAQYT